ncbi:hypothetical protein [Gulosibacter sp. 10]|uniref:hypothetical protein n=1 Tax=Gulosibacter sp. 10 TaxID=1255570 RepID=UPI00097EF4C1|nr:hypothetical protein [Gulosibacter sp. 10]SJM64530.1 hypothetical protein FM112_10290 [Gulosibacter sp. 10]
MTEVRALRDLPWNWGSTDGIEREDDGTQRRLAARAVESTAAPEALFLWLCQLRRAPYSYDWLDNLGRRSPRIPDPSLTVLRTGQRVMTIFTLIGFEPNRSLTIRMRPGWPTRTFGSITVRYAIVPADSDRTVLRGDLRMPPIGSGLGRPRRYLLAWGDLLMMRKQLRTLRMLAEQTPAPACASGAPNDGGR